MANANSPRGLVPYAFASGAVYNGAFNTYYVPAGNGTALYLGDPVTVELVTSIQHKVSLKKMIDWMSHEGGTSPKEIAMKARVREG